MLTGYIDRVDLIQEIAGHPRVYVDAIDFSDLFEIIVNAPSVDVHEVTHGQWTMKPWDAFTFRCSVCGSVFGGKFNFCTNCGARMDKEKEKK